MCGRITTTFEFSDIRVRWNLDRDLTLYTPRFNIASERPPPNIPVIIRHKGNECGLMHWGLIPSWGKLNKKGKKDLSGIRQKQKRAKTVGV